MINRQKHKYMHIPSITHEYRYINGITFVFRNASCATFYVQKASIFMGRTIWGILQITRIWLCKYASTTWKQWTLNFSTVSTVTFLKPHFKACLIVSSKYTHSRNFDNKLQLYVRNFGRVKSQSLELLDSIMFWNLRRTQVLLLLNRSIPFISCCRCNIS